MQFRKRLSPITNVDLVPMIDVVFQMVVFFMVSSTFIQAPGIRINLPESSTAEPMNITQLVVTIIDDQMLYLNKDPYSLQTLDEALGEYTETERNTVGAVIIEGDENVSYALMVKVLDILRKHGFKGVNLKMNQDGTNDDTQRPKTVP